MGHLRERQSVASQQYELRLIHFTYQRRGRYRPRLSLYARAPYDIGVGEQFIGDAINLDYRSLGQRNCLIGRGRHEHRS